MIYDDYITYTTTYQTKYGDKTVVFMQVGDFFELYGVQNDQEKAGADMYRIAELCNIQVSRKNKSILENSRQNPLMAGFPLQTLSKFIHIMLQNQYTIVVIRQTTPPPNPKREVTEILSPATTLTTNTHEGSYLAVLYWEQLDHLHLGISLIDVTTGNSYIYEAYSTSTDPEFSKDEAFRILHTFQPKETICLGDLEQVNIQYNNLRFIWTEEKLKHYKNPAYQNTLLEKIFGKHILSPIEHLHLEHQHNARIAFTYAIQFAYEHSSDIIKKIEPPISLKNETHLILESNAIYQLNICSTRPSDTPLLSILDKTATAFGSRLFKERLLNPIISIPELNKRYDQIETYKPHYKQLHALLSNITDLERTLRKIALLRLQPCEWSSFYSSLTTAKAVLEYLNLPTTQLDTLTTECTNTLDLDECSKYNLQDIYTSIFRSTYNKELDTLQQTITKSLTALNDLKTSLPESKLDCNERDGYFLTLTKRRFEQLPKNLTTNFQAKPISPSSTILRITNPTIEKHSNTILVTQRKISQLNITLYNAYLEQFYETHAPFLKRLIQQLAEIDIATTNAKNATEYNYTRPILESTSPFKATAIRHPIIERLDIKTPYVSNDIHLSNGFLLYGINAAGKSSLMKSVGLAVLMAQSGMYVAASELIFAPYHHLFTRIASSDNIYRGLSTFTIEMLELKNILHRCDPHSLVLGDELCAGTESVSGIAIVAAGIQALIEKQSHFVFATHLHELTTYVNQATIAHLHVEFDPVTQKIIYDRKLKSGSGSPLYGLEVCKFLKLPETFLKNAERIRKSVQGLSTNLLEPKPSRYQSNTYMATCELCGLNPATETHHIKPQKDLDPNDAFKNHPANLINLCEACHLKQHHSHEKITEKVLTSDGIDVKVVQDTPAPTPTINIQNHLMYQIQGWYYRYDPKTPWKKLHPKNYKQVFTKLNLSTNNITQFLMQNQSDCLQL